jgi:hypothetical protein
MTFEKYEAFMIDIDVNVRKIEDSEECTEEGCTCVACNDKDCDRAIDLNKRSYKWNVNVSITPPHLNGISPKSTML